jgi:heme a synthase
MLAIIHAATAQIFFALTIGLAVFTSASWKQAIVPAVNDGGRLRRLCAVTTGLIYLQIVFGAVLRHTGERLDAHLLFAALVAIHVILVVMRVTRHHAGIDLLNKPALALVVLLLVQVALGGASYAAKFTTLWPISFDAIVFITTLHLAMGALMLAASVALTLRAYRLSAPSEHGRRKKVLTEQFSV